MIEIPWPSGGALRVATASYSGEIQDSHRGLDNDRFLKSSLEDLLLFGNENVVIETRMRKDNPGVAQQVLSINSVTKERRLSGCLDSNREELDI